APLPKIPMSQPNLDLLKAKFDTPHKGSVLPEVGDEEKSSVPWQKRQNSEGDAPTLEFTAAEPKTLDVELAFDSFESETPVKPPVRKLLSPSPQVDEASAVSSTKTLVSSQAMFYQGDLEGDGKNQTGPDTKYSMFLPDGTPVRATTNIKMTESEGMTRKSEAKSAPEDGSAADSDEGEDDEK
ncbi:MAG: hypothetical protein ACREH5_05500, partial [Candidatus Omnitrophota bacterium]